MTIVEQIAVVLAVIAAAGIMFSPIFLMQAYARRMSRRSAAKVAGELELEFVESVPAGWLAQFAGVLPFERGRHRSARNVMQGSWKGREVILLEHCSLVGSGKSSKYVWQEIVILPHAADFLPDFRMVPPSLFQRIKSWFFKSSAIGLGDSATVRKFSRRYVLTGTDAARIAKCFSEDLQLYFISHPKLHLEVNRGRAFLWMPDWRGEFGWRSASDFHRLLAKFEPTMERLSQAAKLVESSGR